MRIVSYILHIPRFCRVWHGTWGAGADFRALKYFSRGPRRKKPHTVHSCRTHPFCFVLIVASTHILANNETIWRFSETRCRLLRPISRWYKCKGMAVPSLRIKWLLQLHIQHRKDKALQAKDARDFYDHSINKGSEGDDNQQWDASLVQYFPKTQLLMEYLVNYKETRKMLRLLFVGRYWMFGSDASCPFAVLTSMEAFVCTAGNGSALLAVSPWSLDWDWTQLLSAEEG